MKNPSKAYFDAVAPAWDDMRTTFFSEQIIESIKEDILLRPNIHIIDIGAGSGFLTQAFVDQPIQITAIDQSQKMLDVMASKLQEYTNVTYIQSDVAQLNLPTESYDYIIANMFLHHVEEPANVIAKMKSLLKPGGKLIITDLDKHNHQFLIEEHNDRWLGFERADIKSWYRDAGFSDVVISCTSCNCTSASTASNDMADITVFKAVGDVA